MPIDLKIPSVGESITEVQIAEWLKKDGDEVKKDENVAVIDSEKTTLELPAPENGRLKILKQAGETVPVGEVVGTILADGESETAAPQKAKSEKRPAAPKRSEGGKAEQSEPEAVSDLGTTARPEKVEPAEKKKQPTVVEAEKDAESGRAAAAMPAVQEVEARKTAPLSAEKAVSPSQPQPAREKSEPARTPAPEEKISPPPKEKPSGVADAGERVVPMTMLRRTAARRLVEAKQQMAMLTTFNEVDMTAVQTARKELQESFEKRHGVKLGFMSFFVKAAAAALKEFSQVNAEIRGNDIVYHERFDIGVAIASDRGLVVPVVRDAGKLSYAGIEKAIADFARRAREGKLKPQELEGGTFTITNGGVFGSLLSTPIINPPQTAILGMHSIQDRPIALNGQVVIRPMMYLALTYDHRLVDGREAVMFLRRVKEAVESPIRAVIEA